MKTILNVTALILLVVPYGCIGKAPGKPTIGHPAQDDPGSRDSQGTESPGGEKRDPEVKNLSLTEEIVEGKERRFDFSKPTELAWLNTSELVFVHDDGTSIAYDFNSQNWASAAQTAQSGYDKIYDFRLAKFVGFQPDLIHFGDQVGDDPVIRQIAYTSDLKNMTPISIAPNSISYLKDGQLRVVLVHTEKARIIQPDETPVGVALAKACNQGCDFWAFDGKVLSFYKEGAGWYNAQLKLSISEEDPITNLALYFSDAEATVESAAIRTKSGKIFALYQGEKNGNSQVAWSDVQKLSTNFCIPCHTSDGYDKESVWLKKNKLILERISTLSDTGSQAAMPKPGSPQEKAFSSADRQKIVTWLKDNSN